MSLLFGFLFFADSVPNPNSNRGNGLRTVAYADTKEYDGTHEDEDVDDMARMNVMSEAPMIGALRRRYLDKQVRVCVWWWCVYVYVHVVVSGGRFLDKKMGGSR